MSKKARKKERKKERKAALCKQRGLFVKRFCVFETVRVRSKICNGKKMVGFIGEERCWKRKELGLCETVLPNGRILHKRCYMISLYKPAWLLGLVAKVAVALF